MYRKPPSNLAVFLAVTLGIGLFLLRQVGREILWPPILVLVAGIALGIGILVGFFGGRRAAYLYQDRIEIRGPLAILAYERFGIRIWTAQVPYQSIVALGRGGVESPRISFLIIHQRVGSRTRKFRIDVVPLDKYLDLKKELLARIRPGCELYSALGFGRKGPF